MKEALIGGALIGLSAALMLILNGRIAGISGIVLGSLRAKKGDLVWRFLFIAGLFCGALLLNEFYPQAFSRQNHTKLPFLLLAGLLVGFGTSMGNGCTSGHGICGMARLSMRSILATLCFMILGILSATFLRPFLEMQP